MRLAAVPYDSGSSVKTDELLWRVARRLQGQGLRVAGAVQVNEPNADGCRCVMTLEDLSSGRRVVASEHRGPLARGCRLDTGALVEMVGLVTNSLGSSTDMVIVNKFGKREAEGRGFRPVIETAVLLDIPVLVGLNLAHRDSWNAFVDHQGIIVEPTDAAIAKWCQCECNRASLVGV